ncbi:putative urea ABC transporter substrate-binding protein [Gilvimarinus agarilyticus]|uniref:putative urea ABC transporter substrate-binding protein n=1 Tax=Gilvimarinus agarilyticus TaxID=679259 RepID=UPI000696605B|nr:putative urea ABC transporter substrate-binding protein [Gilvimarinus agarilyticus]
MKLLPLFRRFTFVFLSLFVCLQSSSAFSAESFRLAWTLYPGYMPWDYARTSGIMEKWAKKYNIEIEIVQLNDYIEAINQYSAGQFDAAMMATMDAYTIPAAAGVDSTIIAVTDYSDGNDVIILKEGDSVKDLHGKQVNLIEYSVSHYFLARALEEVGMSERDLTLVNTSDADMVALYAQPSVEAMVTWNPMASEILKRDDATSILSSRTMPGELTDSLVVSSQTLADHPELGKALIGAWYETLAVMSLDNDAGRVARESMGIAAGTNLEGYEQQLKDTHLYYQPSAVEALMSSPALQESMSSIAEFSFEKGLLGDGAASAENVGIAYPGGKVWGNPANVTLRFDNSFVGQAAAGEL